ncbi:hypothetical protein [Bacillus mycoides]|nr:hypothetical protein [Bacillus mycoides]
MFVFQSNYTDELKLNGIKGMACLVPAIQRPVLKICHNYTDK